MQMLAAENLTCWHLWGPSQILSRAESHRCCCLQWCSVFFLPYPQGSRPHFTFQAVSQRLDYARHSLLTNHETSQPTEKSNTGSTSFHFLLVPKENAPFNQRASKKTPTNRGKSWSWFQKPSVFFKTKEQPVIMYLRKTQKTRTRGKSDIYPLASQINGVHRLHKLHTMISRCFLVQHVAGPR